MAVNCQASEDPPKGEREKKISSKFGKSIHLKIGDAEPLVDVEVSLNKGGGRPS